MRALLLGLGVGAAAGMLLATRRAARMRADVAVTTREWIDYTMDHLERRFRHAA